MRRPQIFALCLSIVGAAFCNESIPIDKKPDVIVSTEDAPIAEGKFQPTWQSLEQYEAPEWFRDAKFGIWAHWGPQCQPEAGDWYGRHMYVPAHWQYNHHLEHYGHPSKMGFKDVIHAWKADKWNPDKLVAFYKRVGARYFFAMANHHDNLDLWDSSYQPWNSVAVGPKKDIVAGWAKAARAQGLPFGLSVHAAHAWLWYEPAQGADREGPFAGVPYDGKLTRANGKGTWWEGLDPQDLYAQDHEPSANFQDPGSIHSRWNWSNGATQPDAAYCQKFYNRTADLIKKFEPDLIYFDDTALPLWPVSNAGLELAADFYNTNLAKTDDAGNGVLFGKILDADQLKCLTWDIERGVPNSTLPYPWQTDTCIGGWHYDRGLYDRSGYKDAKTVIHMLADIVSKNGNLLLNIPVRGDGSIDDKEEKILDEIAAWMDVNSEAIYATRPWKTFGEGPASAGAKMQAQGFNEGKGVPFTSEDIRYTASKDGQIIYAIALGWPEKPLRLTALGSGEEKAAVAKVELVGSRSAVDWHEEAEALVIQPPPPAASSAQGIAAVYRIRIE